MAATHRSSNRSCYRVDFGSDADSGKTSGTSALGTHAAGFVPCQSNAQVLELFNGQSPSNSMLRLVAGTVLLLLIGFTEALAVEEIKKDNIGPWEIEATFKDNKFDHCAISRKVDEVVASFLRTSDGLSLTLKSPNWKLERGKNYPVRMKAGAASWNTDVAAETNSVSVPDLGEKIQRRTSCSQCICRRGCRSNNPNSSGSESRGTRQAG